MNDRGSLVERAQMHLDARRDPFDDAVLCQALMMDAEALEQVTHLRAVHLELCSATSGRAVTDESPILRPRRASAFWRGGWIALPAAAALLLWMTSERHPTLEPQSVTPMALHDLEPTEEIPAVPAILNVREEVRTTAVQQRPQGGLLRLKITTTEHSAQT